jgi:hypothetical protein
VYLSVILSWRPGRDESSPTSKPTM